MSDSEPEAGLREITFRIWADGRVGLSHEDMTMEELMQMYGALSVVVLSYLYRQGGRDAVTRYTAHWVDASAETVAAMVKGEMPGTVIDRLADER